jgi:hypothetical protein
MIREEYEALKLKWIEFNETIPFNHPEKYTQEQKNFLDIVHQIDVDVVRTDREVVYFEADDISSHRELHNSKPYKMLQHVLLTHTWDNSKPYTQGMNEIASPFLYVLKDEAMAYWCLDFVLKQMVKLYFSLHS